MTCAKWGTSPAHRNKRHAWIDLAIPAPVDDPRLLTVRRQLVCCRSGQQDWLPNLNYGHSLVRGTQQIGQYGICIHKGLPFARIVGCELGLGPCELGRCDFHHTQCPPESKSELGIPEGYFTAFEGTFQAQEEATRTIGLLSLVSLGLIFAILYSRYRSAVLSLIIMDNIPLALIGSVAALSLAGQPLSLASMVGFITLAGIAARNGILKVSHSINLALANGLPFGPELVVRGSLERMTPVLMTALSAGVALLSLLIDPAAPGKEILHPVAVTIFGGC